MNPACIHFSCCCCCSCCCGCFLIFYKKNLTDNCSQPSVDTLCVPCKGGSCPELFDCNIVKGKCNGKFICEENYVGNFCDTRKNVLEFYFISFIQIFIKKFYFAFIISPFFSIRDMSLFLLIAKNIFF